VLNRLDYFHSHFFWQGDSEKKKYWLTRWNIVCRPKDQGGLGVQDLLVKSSALLGKWLFKLLTEDGIWPGAKPENESTGVGSRNYWGQIH
jgi:hypothetical protein